jgi:hypothetical protein
LCSAFYDRTSVLGRLEAKPASPVLGRLPPRAGLVRTLRLAVALVAHNLPEAVARISAALSELA